MSAIQVNATPVSVYELKTGTKSLGLFQLVSKWEGLGKLQHIGNGNVLIVGFPPLSVFESVFNDVFGAKHAELTVISGTPDLVSQLVARKTEAA